MMFNKWNGNWSIIHRNLKRERSGYLYFGISIRYTDSWINLILNLNSKQFIHQYFMLWLHFWNLQKVLIEMNEKYSVTSIGFRRNWFSKFDVWKKENIIIFLYKTMYFYRGFLFTYIVNYNFSLSCTLVLLTAWKTASCSVSFSQVRTYMCVFLRDGRNRSPKKKPPSNKWKSWYDVYNNRKVNNMMS